MSLVTVTHAFKILKIYSEKLELQLEHYGNHVTFLNLDIEIKDGIFVYKLLNERDAFSFEIVRMPFICSNIPSNTFEILRIIRHTKAPTSSQDSSYPSGEW